MVWRVKARCRWCHLRERMGCQPAAQSRHVREIGRRQAHGQRCAWPRPKNDLWEGAWLNSKRHGQGVEQFCRWLTLREGEFANNFQCESDTFDLCIVGGTKYTGRWSHGRVPSPSRLCVMLFFSFARPVQPPPPSLSSPSSWPPLPRRGGVIRVAFNS
jgi:hypothetical protein